MGLFLTNFKKYAKFLIKNTLLHVCPKSDSANFSLPQPFLKFLEHQCWDVYFLIKKVQI